MTLESVLNLFLSVFLGLAKNSLAPTFAGRGVPYVANNPPSATGVCLGMVYETLGSGLFVNELMGGQLAYLNNLFDHIRYRQCCLYDYC